jgi:hypothetical protein
MGFYPPKSMDYGVLQSYGVTELWVSIMAHTWWTTKMYGVSQIMGYGSYGLRQLRL